MQKGQGDGKEILCQTEGIYVFTLAKKVKKGYYTNMKVIATNKKAYHDYTVIDKFEVGIQLVGCEVKSLRKGEVNLRDSFCRVSDQLVLVGCHIKHFDKGSYANVDEWRERRLLMHANEIRRLRSKVVEKGYTVVPLQMYFSGSLVKVEIALVKGKQTFDKHRAIAERDAKRDLDRQIKDAKH